MDTQDQRSDSGSIDSAMHICDNNIKRHGQLATMSMMSGVTLLLAIITFAAFYAVLTAKVKDNERLELLRDIDTKEEALAQASQIDKPWSLSRMQFKLDEIRASKPKDIAPEVERNKWENSFNDAQKEFEIEKIKFKDEIDKRVGKALEDLKISRTKYAEHDSGALLTQELMLGIVALSALIISVFTALYRFHQKEIAKNEHYKLGFSRVLVAANNADKKGFLDEVRTALTAEAFSMPSEGLFGKNEKKLNPRYLGTPQQNLQLE